MNRASGQAARASEQPAHAGANGPGGKQPHAAKRGAQAAQARSAASGPSGTRPEAQRPGAGQRPNQPAVAQAGRSARGPVAWHGEQAGPQGQGQTATAPICNDALVLSSI